MYRTRIARANNHEVAQRLSYSSWRRHQTAVSLHSLGIAIGFLPFSASVRTVATTMSQGVLGKRVEAWPNTYRQPFGMRT
jgi:hypothetical protein